jgi:hypothetical protein
MGRELPDDSAADGRRLRFLNVMDEHSCLRLTILVGLCCKAMDEVVGLEELTGL